MIVYHPRSPAAVDNHEGVPSMKITTLVDFSVFILAALLILAVLSGCSRAKADTYVWMGDSLAVGMAMATKVPSVARVGATYHDLQRQLKLVPKGVTHAFVSVGTNEAAIAGHVYVWAIREWFKPMGIVPIIVGPANVHPPRLADEIARIDNALRIQCEELGVQYVSMLHFRTNAKGDGIHATMPEYKARAEYVYRQVRK